MARMATFVLFVAALLGSAYANPVKTVTFAPENKLWIDENDKDAAGITQAQFDQVIDKVTNVLTPIVKSKGGNLSVERRWTDGTVNAYANRSGKNWMVHMFGGLARYQGMTPDGFALVMCHEIAHHIGGAPKTSMSGWASVEGQSDYIGTMKCLREVFKGDDNVAIVKGMTIDPIVKSKCSQIYSDEASAAYCMRASMTGKVLADVLSDLGQEGRVAFDTPDTNVVSSTDEQHPAAQCRLDTYFAGALCDKDMSANLSDRDALVGTCNTSQGFILGTRPLCWFKP